jgi:hypothetical protein
VALREAVPGARVAEDVVTQWEELAVGAGADVVEGGGLEVGEDGSGGEGEGGGGGFGEVGAEQVELGEGVRAEVLAGWVQAVLLGEGLPEF